MARKEKKYHYIYKTTNVLSGKYYIGMHSTHNLDDGYLGSGTRLRRSIKKYGKENFIREILEYCDTRNILKSREEEIVNLNEIAKIDCINLKVGGYGGFSDEEHITKFNEGREWGRILGGKKTGNKLRGTTMSDEYKDKISDGLNNYYENNVGLFTGKNHSEETKNKMSESMKGKGKGSNNSQYGKCWITNEVDSKKIFKGDLIPEGWRLGRKMK
jgi:hypothetical protein